MAFCSECGEELDDKAKFCDECGEPVGGAGEGGRRDEEPGPPEEPRRRRRWLGVVIIVGIIIVAASILAALTFEVADEREGFAYDPDEVPDTLRLELDLDGGEFEIDFTNDSAEPVVSIDYHKKWSGFVTRRTSFDTSRDEVVFKSAKVAGTSESDIEITLRSDVVYDLEVNSESGSLSILSDEPGTTFGDLDVETRSGSCSLELEDAEIEGAVSVAVSSGSLSILFTGCRMGNLVSETDSGSSSLLLADCTVDYVDVSFDSGSVSARLERCSVRVVDISGDSGSVSMTCEDLSINDTSVWELSGDSVALDITQNTVLGAQVSVVLTTEDRGDIDVGFKGDASAVRASFRAETDSGDIEVKAGQGFTSTSSTAMTSEGFEDSGLQAFTVSMSSEDGDIEVEAEMSG